VTDSATLEQVAAAARDCGWPAQVQGDALTAPYSAPSAGPAPWHLYRLSFHTAYGVANPPSPTEQRAGVSAEFGA
jgi:hypothetical protein